MCEITSKERATMLTRISRLNTGVPRYLFEKDLLQEKLSDSLLSDVLNEVRRCTLLCISDALYAVGYAEGKLARLSWNNVNAVISTVEQICGVGLNQPPKARQITPLTATFIITGVDRDTNHIGILIDSLSVHLNGSSIGSLSISADDELIPAFRAIIEICLIVSGWWLDPLAATKSAVVANPADPFTFRSFKLNFERNGGRYENLTLQKLCLDTLETCFSVGEILIPPVFHPAHLPLRSVGNVFSGDWEFGEAFS